MNEEVFGGRYEFSRKVAVELAEFLRQYDNADNRHWLVISDPPQLRRAEDYGSVRDRRWTLQRRGGRGESHVVLVHVHAEDRE